MIGQIISGDILSRSPPKVLKSQPTYPCRMINPIVNLGKYAKKGYGSGKNNPFYGRHHTEKTKKKIREKAKNRLPWNKGLKGEEYTKYFKKKSGAPKGRKSWIKGLTKETDERVKKLAEKLSQTRKDMHIKLSNKRKQEIGKTTKRLWKNKEYREKVIRNSLRGLLKRPTSFEKVIIDLIKEYKLPFKYVGNGKLLIGYKNPDFVHDNKKILIEVYNFFHHKNNYERKRSKHFRRYGWKTIFISEGIINNKNKILNKIEEVYK